MFSFLVLLASLPGAGPVLERPGDSLPAGAVARLGTMRFCQGSLVNSLAFAPDGKTIASIGEQEVSLWETETGRLVRHWPASKRTLILVRFSPDGTSLVTVAQEERKLSVWSTEGKLRFRETVYPDSEPVFSGDGKELAFLFDNHKIRILDSTTGKEKRTLTSRHDLHVLALSHDGTLLAAGDTDGVTRLYDTTNGKQLRTYPGDTYGVTALAIARDGKSLATGGGRGFVGVWETGSEEEISSVKDCPETVASLRFNPAGTELTVLRGPGTVQVYEASTGEEKEKHGKKLKDDPAVTCSADGKWLAWAEGCRIRLLDLATDTELELPDHQPSFAAAGWSPDGKVAALRTEDGSLLLWETFRADRVKPRRLTPPPGTAFAPVFSPDGKLVASGGADEAPVRLWNVASGKEVRAIALKTPCPTPLAFLPGDRLLAVQTGESLTFLDTETGTVRWNLDYKNAGFPPVFTADGRVVGIFSDKILTLWEVAAGKERQRTELREVHLDKALHLALSPDGSLVATGEEKGEVQLHDLDTGRVLCRFQAIGFLQTLAFSPTSQMLATGCDGLVQLWDVAKGRELVRLSAHGDVVTGLSFSPDGNYLLTASHDETALVWDVAALLDLHRKPQVISKPLSVEELWADLNRDDGVRAFAAVRQLAARPKESLPFLKQHLTPVRRPEAGVLPRLLADLDNDQFEQREQAVVHLCALDRIAEAAVRKALAANPTPQARRGLEEVFAHLQGLPGAEQVRQLRAVEALERNGQAEALALLVLLAEGAPEARLTEAARTAVERLKRRAASPR
jgi:WD40 repeat protein